MDERTYYIRRSPKELPQGPFALARIRGYVAAGRVRADMYFSADGKNWWTGNDWPELFPPAAPAPAAISGDQDPAASVRRVPTRSRPGAEPRTRSRSRPPRRSSLPIVLGITALIVVGIGLAVVLTPESIPEPERKMQRLIALLEESCEIVEGMVGKQPDLDTAARLLTVAQEIDSLQTDLSTVRVGFGQLDKWERYEQEVRALSTRMAHAKYDLEHPEEAAADR